MIAVILAGGFGNRLSEETYLKPKPMVEIGGKPILWHIMKLYFHYHKLNLFCTGKNELLSGTCTKIFIQRLAVTR